MPQLPAPASVTVVPDTEQAVLSVVKVTGSPEVAVAVISNGESPSFLSGNASKAMVCASLVIVNGSELATYPPSGPGLHTMTMTSPAAKRSLLEEKHRDLFPVEPKSLVPVGHSKAQRCPKGTSGN